MRWLSLLLVAAMLSGCTDPPWEDDTARPDPPEEPEDPAEEPPAADPQTPEDNGTEPQPREPVTWEITIQGNAFVDGSITVQQGDEVRWLHQDGAIQHTVTSDDGAFHSGDCPGTSCMTEFTSAEFSHTFDETGEFPYHCEVHPSMTDTITVLAVYDGTP